MVKTFKDLKEIKFPVFELRSKDWYRKDGVLFIDHGLILDDKNMPGQTLGVRRLQCGRPTELYKLKRAHITIKSLILCRRTTFIDSNGMPFVYRRTTTSHVKYYRVKSIDPKETTTLVWLLGVNYPLVLPYGIPHRTPEWVGVLHYRKLPWLVYDLRLDRGKDSYRRV